ncbi:hypothetical protein GCM10011390_43730 [Aureimonas endophytica]|uniref:Flagellar protein FliL n=1 Tax=Aureimonas endophytica TaxID=2027858 RepID=A0A916ZZE4_9HYPH|nr:hypothetical protein [Aureimonas endophytica]GGE19741.1 hypothetical protein GCM10011390_43730 [Aureimonas endophytica]
MIKLLAIGLWVCVASLGASYVTASMQGPKVEEHKEPTYFNGLDWRKTESITVPILTSDKIAGYVLARFVYTIDGEIGNKLAVPPDSFILNDAFAAVYQTSGFDFQHPEKYDLEGLKKSIKETVNKRYGQELVHEVMVEQFDFLPKDDMAPKTASK